MPDEVSHSGWPDRLRYRVIPTFCDLSMDQIHELFPIHHQKSLIAMLNLLSEMEKYLSHHLIPENIPVQKLNHSVCTVIPPNDGLNLSYQWMYFLQGEKP